MKFTLGFSPCPNDTFIFDALVNQKIDTGGLEFDVQMEDVQTLNEWALQERLDISKISYGVLPLLLKEYIVLSSGGALGKGVGPLLISTNEVQNADDVNDMVVAIPGENTTAHMLFSLAYPQARQKRFMIFSEIENAVLQKQADAGVIIHENRFTYQQKGLKKLADLGHYWEEETGQPIPLGGIVMKRSIPVAVQKQVDELIRKSVEYAFSYYPAITGYVKQHSQEMSESVMRQHIDLYVNDYSVALGEAGKGAVRKLLDVYKNVNDVELDEANIFLF